VPRRPEPEPGSPCNLISSPATHLRPPRHGIEEEGRAHRDGGCGGDAAAAADVVGRGRRLRGGPGGVLGAAGGAGDVPDVRAGAGDGDGADARLLRGPEGGAAEQPQVPVRAGQGPGRPQPRPQAQRRQGARPPRRLPRARQHLRLPQYVVCLYPSTVAIHLLARVGLGFGRCCP
jgi:hypothetical protein